jgi:hypothetical protein
MNFKLIITDKNYSFCWYKNNKIMLIIEFKIIGKKTSDKLNIIDVQIINIKFNKRKESVEDIEESIKRSLWVIIEYLLYKYGSQDACKMTFTYNMRKQGYITDSVDMMFVELGFNLEEKSPKKTIKEVLQNDIMNIISDEVVQKDLKYIKKTITE